MATSPNTSGPRRGDVVVAPDATSDRAYRLRVFRGAIELGFFTREDAVRDATTFAEIHRVDVWYTADGIRFERAFRCRSQRRSAWAAREVP